MEYITHGNHKLKLKAQIPDTQNCCSVENWGGNTLIGTFRDLASKSTEDFMFLWA